MFKPYQLGSLPSVQYPTDIVVTQSPYGIISFIVPSMHK